MRCLVTGAGGQLATELVRRAPAGHDVQAMDIDMLDITDRAAVLSCIEDLRPGVVFNAAAWADVDAAEADEDAALAVNRDGPAYLSEACSHHGARLVHVSTDFVFDGMGSRPCRIDDTPSPLGVYGQSKLAGEQAVLECLGDAALVVRTAWLYSAHGQNFVRTMLGLMMQGDHLKVVADQRGTPTAASSLAGVLWELVDLNAGGLLHWTDGGEATWHEFAEFIRDTARQQGLLDHDVVIDPIPSTEWPTRAQRPTYTVLDITVTEDLLKRSPRPWREEVADVVGELATVGELG